MSYVRSRAEDVLPAPHRPAPSLWRSVAGSMAGALTTLVVTALALAALPRLIAWAVVHGVWSGDAQACRNAGACWIFLREKMPFILFGIYPEMERWRPMLVVLMLIALTLWTMPRSHWTLRTLAVWGVGLPAAVLLMAGGVGGLTAVPTSAWGGLPVTLLLTVASLALGFPLGVMLALARQSHLPAFRWCAVAFIEVFRGLPLLTLLFVASFLVPLLLPSGMTFDYLLRALVAFTLSSGAFFAEVVRGGLQGVPRSQEEAARALGLSQRTILFSIILPQAIRTVLPPLTSTIVVIVKNTSLVLVVGLFDLLSAGRVVLSDPAWPMPYAETYLLIALVYFVICYGFTTYSLHLEHVLREGRR